VNLPLPTDREFDILKVLWDRGPSTVRTVHKVLSAELPIVQNTVQSFLRTMEEKGLVRHKVVGRAFLSAPVQSQEPTKRNLLSELLTRAFDGAVDQLVHSAISLKAPSADELRKLEEIIAAARRAQSKPRNKDE
jgi:BlaI family penicillinase repressor